MTNYDEEIALACSGRHERIMAALRGGGNLGQHASSEVLHVGHDTAEADVHTLGERGEGRRGGGEEVVSHLDTIWQRYVATAAKSCLLDVVAWWWLDVRGLGLC